jgi:hypothetical protein
MTDLKMLAVLLVLQKHTLATSLVNSAHDGMVKSSAND